ncbi:MAG: deaminase [Pseudonocardia sp.]|jgi:dihydrofolate reductase|nr:deaminase [Pseudonocardia sp.]
MGRIVAVEYISLDGVVQGPGHAEEDREGGFDRGGWSAPWFSEHGRLIPSRFRAADAFLFGRLTYDIWAVHWPGVTEPHDEVAQALNTRPKYVVSTTLTDPSWAGTTVINGDLSKEIPAVRDAHDRDIVTMGSAQLAQALIEHDLVDRYELWVHPVVVGGGKRLFGDQVPAFRLTLADATTTPSGLAILGYERAT